MTLLVVILDYGKLCDINDKFEPYRVRTEQQEAAAKKWIEGSGYEVGAKMIMDVAEYRTSDQIQNAMVEQAKANGCEGILIQHEYVLNQPTQFARVIGEKHGLSLYLSDNSYSAIRHGIDWDEIFRILNEWGKQFKDKDDAMKE